MTSRFRVPLPTATDLLRCEHMARLGASRAGLTPEAAIAQLRNVPAFLTIDQRLTVTGDLAIQSGPDLNRSLLVVRGDGMIDCDGRPLSINPAGRIQIHGLESERPKFMARVSRDRDGNSNNNCRVANLDATGYSIAHVVYDAVELTETTNCNLQQYNGDGAALVLSNAPRPWLDESERAKATNSGHMILGGTISNYGTPTATLTDQNCGCGARLSGLSERVIINGTWFCGTGATTALSLVCLETESWPGGGRWNIPQHVILNDCSPEGAPLIRLWGYEDLLPESRIDGDPWKVVTARMPDGSRRRILTLRGLSAESFVVVAGDGETDLFAPIN